jgi:hypothetical protein
MPQTPREIVKKCLTFDNPERIPVHIWSLPWAEAHHPQELRALKQRYPDDFSTPEYRYRPSQRVKGDPYTIGQYTDEWGCVFQNLQDGVIGEVRVPILKDITDWKSIEPPYEQLPVSNREIQEMYDSISRSYENSDKFMMANINPRPWERYQFIRGSENAMIDIMMPELGTAGLLKNIHDFHLREVEMWVKSEVDAISFMDDWGAQNRLLIQPNLWRDMFKPLYKDYCDLAKAYGKFAFMHSDGHITAIYPDLIEIGVDAINSQLFCMNMEDVSKIAKGKISFWGEIDRQHILTDSDPQVGRDAVQKVRRHLYDPRGGIIAQLEFGPGANPQTILAVMDEWKKIQDQSKRMTLNT